MSEVWAACRRRPTPVGGALLAVLTLLMWRIGADAALPAYLYLGVAGTALAAVDLQTRRLPNAVVLPSYVIALVLLGAAAAAGGSAADYLRGLLGLAALFGFYLLLATVGTSSAGMGFGDVKLAGVLGLYLGWLGWDAVVIGGFAAFLLGALVGLGLIATRRATRRTHIPFGPFMLVGALVGILAAHPVAGAYLGS